MRNNPLFIEMAKEWIEYQVDDLDFSNTIVQLYNPQGKILVDSRFFEDDSFLPENEIHGDTIYKNFHAQTLDEEVPFRSITLPLMENGKVVLLIQAAHSLKPTYSALRNLRLSLLIILPLTLIIASLGSSFFIANLILKPLENLALTAKNISTKNLDLRVELPRRKDEISYLARTFNKMIEELQKSFYAEKQFLQDCSHELRTPLTIMRGEIEILLKQSRTPEDYEKVLNSNLSEIKRLARLVEELLILSRVEVQDQRPHFVDASVKKILEESIEDWTLVAQSKKIKLGYKNLTPDGKFLAKLIPDKFLRVLINVLDNAVKYTNENGEIHVSLKEENERIFISIKDNGIGISKENLEKVFERFFRETKSESYGFGLGLSMARSIMHVHKGQMTLSSQKGEGTEATLILPSLKNL